jgi:DnaJ-class molecular chaperone
MKGVRRMAMNSASKTAPCPDCNGQGRHARDPETGYKRVCDRCKGSGVVIVREMPQAAPISCKAPDRR